MKDESIVYFAKEWNQDRTSCDQVFDQLARHNKVIWVNSIAMRNPNLASAHDLRRIFSKIRKCLGGLKQVGPTAWVLQPVVIPLPYSGFAQRVNQILLRGSIRRALAKLGMRNPQLWSFLPNTAYMVGQLNESVVVYYCIDEWASFSFYDSKKIVAMEQELLRKADVCFATAQSLLESRRQSNPNTHLALHGVDFQHFARALLPETVIPDDIANLPRPIIGFFGMIHEWLDLDLIEKIADRHPEWSIVLIGKSMVNLDRFRARTNVHLLGRRPYETLPAYCKAFDVATIPFLVNDLTRSVNPIKLREYLSAGVPVVSTDLPEVKYFGDLAMVASTSDEFIAKIERGLQTNSPAERQRRSAAMAHETWEEKVYSVSNEVLKAKSQKHHATTSRL